MKKIISKTEIKGRLADFNSNEPFYIQYSALCRHKIRRLFKKIYCFLCVSIIFCPLPMSKTTKFEITAFSFWCLNVSIVVSFTFGPVGPTGPNDPGCPRLPLSPLSPCRRQTHQLCRRGLDNDFKETWNCYLLTRSSFPRSPIRPPGPRSPGVTLRSNWRNKNKKKKKERIYKTEL